MLQSELKRFDMTMPPIREKAILRPVTWLLSFPAVWAHRAKITKVNTKDLKPPYILLCNHNAFLDFKVATAAIFPHRANYVVAIDGFIKRESLMRNVGCICKRKFTNDIVLVKNLKQVVKNGDIVVLYPEARYSLCGTNAVLPESLGKLCKMFGVPVVTLITHGHHITTPFWNLHERKVKPIEATLTQLMTAEEVNAATSEEINHRINEIFVYDDFAWQKEKGIKVTYEGRAEGLHKVLYQCPHCKTEYQMKTDKNKIWCDACKKTWEMSELGELKAANGVTEFSHIPDWYEWEREQVHKEVESGIYSFKANVRVDSLPNSDGYIPLGEGVLEHNMDGFVLTGEYRGEPYRVEKTVRSMYSCHIEYSYLGKFGDCVDINTNTDTYYIYPQDCLFSVTKIALATEELYKAHSSKSLLEGSTRAMI